jgi:hypothetical protein
VLPSDQNQTLGLLVTVTLEAPFRAYAWFPMLLPFLSASWKSCSVGAFDTASDSASITAVVSKWRRFSSVLSRGNREKWGGYETTVVLFLAEENPW